MKTLSVMVRMSILILLISGCSTTPPTIESFLDTAITSLITGKKISYGNEATCNQFKSSCGSDYKQWTRNNKIACSCK